MESGSKLGHYTISSLIGKGGMGEVYQAKDQTLGRQVAIKVLPEEFARDTDRVARFRREAQLLASLNHPNIAAIHGLEETDGKHFLVLELVEGPTLADRIKQGAIPVEESLKLALQIVEALGAAHQKGVIHRDLKPANIKVTDEGKVKVLDFGLAKAFAGEQAEPNVSQSPTLSMAATQQGIILGTAAYMSPEQAKGRTVDKRTDVWAFGAVLYEMLTGKLAFPGDDVSDILASILKTDPDWNSLPANLHPRLSEVLERSLEKDLKDRYHDVADARVDIQKVMADPSGVLIQPLLEGRPASARSMIPWIAATALISIVLAGVAGWNLRPELPDAAAPVSRFAHVLPEGEQFTRTGRPIVAMSQDGSQMVYVANNQLYLRAMDTLESSPIPGTDEDAAAPFFSPDGQWIGFYSFADSQLKKIPIGGGAPVTLTAAEGPFGQAFWTADDTIVWAQIEGVMTVSANGGTPEILLAPEQGTANRASPTILPDGDTLLFHQGTAVEGQVAIRSLESGEQTPLFPGVNPRYVPTGHLIYGLEDVLYAVPFDLESLEVTGGQVALVESVQAVPMQYSVSDSGSLAYVTGSATGSSTLVWVNRQGGEETFVGGNSDVGLPPGNYWDPRFSPEGRQVAVADGAGDNDVWVYDLDIGTLSRVTFEPGEDHTPVWSPDGTWIAYASTRIDQGQTIFRRRSDGTGSEEPLWETDAHAHVAVWTPDGNSLLLEVLVPGSGNDIRLLTLDSSEPEVRPLLDTPSNETSPRLSPDGQWLAYVSNESGRLEVFVRPFPDLDGRWQVSTGGGTQPVWSRSGRELFYRGEGYVMAVDVEPGSTFTRSVPRRLFQDEYAEAESPTHGYYDTTPNDDRFVMVKVGVAADGESNPLQINVVENWFAELKERVPVD